MDMIQETSEAIKIANDAFATAAAKRLLDQESYEKCMRAKNRAFLISLTVTLVMLFVMLLLIMPRIIAYDSFMDHTLRKQGHIHGDVFWYIDSTGKVELGLDEIGIPEEQRYDRNDLIVYLDENEDILDIITGHIGDPELPLLGYISGLCAGAVAIIIAVLIIRETVGGPWMAFLRYYQKGTTEGLKKYGLVLIAQRDRIVA